MKKTQMSKVHAAALAIAAALCEQLSYEVQRVAHVDVTFPSFTGYKQQTGFRIILLGDNHVVAITTRRPRGGMLCDVQCIRQHWTHLSARDAFNVPSIVKAVSDGVKRQQKKGGR